MRAILLEDIENDGKQKTITIDGKNHHHLVNVVRVKIEEKILILDGQGNKYHAIIKNISKKIIELEIQSLDREEQQDLIHVAFALTKKEAIEEILKICVECGIRRIYPLLTEFSQRKFEMSERLERVIESSMIQSNNPFLPKIESIINFDENFVDKIKNYKKIVFFDSDPSSKVKAHNLVDPKEGAVLIIIGPEGGFSPKEQMLAKSLANIALVHFPIPIMRAPTALACAIGYSFGRFSNWP